MVVWSLGTVLLLGAGLLTLQAQDDEQILYFPHLAVGAGWQTTITYINYSAEEVSCQTDFLSDDGSPLMVSFAGLGTVESRTDVLPPGGAVHQETNVDLSVPLAPGWARANCSGRVKASLLFRRYDGEGVPTAEAGVNATTVPATRFVTFAEQGEGQFGTGVAYANPSDTTAHITFTAKDAAGQMLASATRNLPPGGHGSQNMVHLFGLTSLSGSLEVTSTEPIVSLALNFEADPVFSSLPPGEPDTSAQGSTRYYFPHLAVGASWQTTISYINYSPGEVTCQTDFLSDDGSPLIFSFAGLGKVVSRTDVLPPGGSVHEETNVDLSVPLAPGWARANCSGPAKASLLFRRYDSEGVPTGEATVNAAAVPATRFVTFAQQGEGQFGTGVAYANPSSSAADVTFTARDAAGQMLASATHNLPPGGHGSQNMVDLFDLTSFSGSLEVTSTEPIVSLSLNFEADPVFSSLPPGGVEERIINPGAEPMTDREVLETLYHATGGPSWSNHTNWLSEAPLSEWFGVKTDESSRVTSLSLGGNQLSGPIPLELGQLTYLEVLELGQRLDSTRMVFITNQLSGTIPPELGQLAHLQRLHLEDNQLSGVIPPELGQLTHLQSLSLGSNQLSGVIPSELSKLTNLKELYLWHNQLTGVIPPELGQLTHLGWLSLEDNGLSGAIPRHLLQLSELFKLDIGGTGVCVPADAIFQEWLNMISQFNSSGLVCDGTRRVSFSASTYEVREGERVTVSVRMIDQTRDPVQSVSIPLTARPGGGATTADYSGVPDRVTLASPANEAAFVVTAVKDDDVDPGETVVLGFRRPLPSGITSGDPHTATVTIHEPGTGVVTDREVLEALYHATGGPAWSNRTNWLSEAPLSDWFGVGTDGNGQVTNLSLEDNQLSGTIPPELGGLTNLQNLALADNQLSGTIPPELGGLTNLQNLALADNQFSGTIPPELGGLTRLRRLGLEGNQLSGTIPPELGGLTNLQNLALATNRLSGTIPPELGGLTRLQRLFLGGNQLSGAIPPELGGLTNLQLFGLGGNQLSGAIPPELGGLTNLHWLSFVANDLSGTIPPELGGLTHLRWLNLWGNQLSGTIPPELSGLTSLAGLDLRGNQLSGTIPAELDELTNLEQLNLGFNQDLTGTIPPWLSQLSLSTLSLMATSICVPEDGELQEWLATIEFMPSGLTCGRPAAAMSLIDVAVFYTPTARRIAGGTAEMEAMIDIMVAETNQAYVESGVSQQIVLVAREEIEYTESGNTFTDIERFADPSDGHMDEIHTIRNRVGADLVHLIADANFSIAIAIPSAFGLTCAKCGSLSFAHELGHNMGLLHDRYASPRSTSFPYSHGYVNQRAFEGGAPRLARWRTIMAYPNQCADAGIDCDWILRFSNPNQTYLGDPLGVPGDKGMLAANGPADAVRTLNITRHSVESFRSRASGNQQITSSTLSQARSMVRTGVAVPPSVPLGSLFRVIAPTVRGTASQQISGVLDRATLRRREVSVDIGRLARVADGGPTALRLNLFDDMVLTGIIQQRTPTYSGGYALSGRLAGVAEGRVTLVVNGSVVAGTIRLPGATYHIRPEGAGRHVILLVDPSKLPQGCEVVTRTPGRYQSQGEGERPAE